MRLSTAESCACEIPDLDDDRILTMRNGIGNEVSDRLRNPLAIPRCREIAGVLIRMERQLALGIRMCELLNTVRDERAHVRDWRGNDRQSTRHPASTSPYFNGQAMPAR